MRKLLLGLLLVVGFAFVGASVEAAPTFYRGFELTSTLKADEMGYLPINALMLSGKKRVLKAEFYDLVTDLGGVTQSFAPRDPAAKSIVYIGTNHFIREEGGQTGVFVVWKYNVDTGVYSRLASLRFGREEAPHGYQVLGNEGTVLVVLKNIDGPHCPNRIVDENGASFLSLDMRQPKKGFKAYKPSTAMRTVYRALPACESATGGEENTMISVEINSLPEAISPTIPVTLTATVRSTDIPSGGRMIIGRVGASPANGARLHTCERNMSADQTVCTFTLTPEPGTHNFIALVESGSGTYVGWKNWPTLTVRNFIHF